MPKRTQDVEHHPPLCTHDARPAGHGGAHIEPRHKAAQYAHLHTGQLGPTTRHIHTPTSRNAPQHTRRTVRRHRRRSTSVMGWVHHTDTSGGHDTIWVHLLVLSPHCLVKSIERACLQRTHTRSGSTDVTQTTSHSSWRTKYIAAANGLHRKRSLQTQTTTYTGPHTTGNATDSCPSTGLQIGRTGRRHTPANVNHSHLCILHRKKKRSTKRADSQTKRRKPLP